MSFHLTNRSAVFGRGFTTWHSEYCVGSERENLDEPDEQDIARDEADEEIARRLKEGESYRTIQKELGVSANKVNRVKKLLTQLLLSAKL